MGMLDEWKASRIILETSKINRGLALHSPIDIQDINRQYK
ncbi:hypothetical protein GCM10028791_40950 [Echinicola sediminis]